MTSTKTLTWTTSNGSTMEATIKATCKLTDNISYADGYNINLGKEIYENLEITLKMDGKIIETTNQEPRIIQGICFSTPNWDKIKANGGYAKLGDKVILREVTYVEMMNIIEELQAEVSQSEEIQEVKAIEKAKEERETARESGKIEQYERVIKNGLCPKCGTYCYGDCES